VIVAEVTEEMHRAMVEEMPLAEVIMAAEDLTAVRVTRTAEKERGKTRGKERKGEITRVK
jgi:hypothetical protein